MMTDPRQDAFERLYLHHTVASLAHRIDFHPSMLENRKTFYPPASSRRIRVMSLDEAISQKSPPRPPAPVSTETPKTNNSKPWKKKKRSTRPPAGPSAKEKVNYGGSLSKMIALNSPPKNKTKKDESVNSNASTAKMGNKVENDTEDTANNRANDDADDAEKDLLNSLLDGADGMMEPGAYQGEEGEMVFEGEAPTASLSEQEAALEEALGRAIGEFEAAAALGELPPKV